MLIGIAGIVLTASVLGALADSDADGEATRIILEALNQWDTPLSTAIEIQAASVGCKTGWTDLFSKEWSGTDQGCWYEGQAMDEG